MARPTGLAEQAAHRELAALVDGPWAPAWYWRDDLEAHQAAARDIHHRGGTTQLGTKAHYQPTEHWIDHPTEEGVRGHAWTHQPPSTEGNTRRPPSRTQHWARRTLGERVTFQPGHDHLGLLDRQPAGGATGAPRHRRAGPTARKSPPGPAATTGTHHKRR